VSYDPHFALTAATWSAVRAVDRAQGFLDALALSARWIAELERAALAEEAYHTTVIEGARVTLEQARRVLAGGPTEDVDPDSRREVANVVEAAALLRDHLAQGLPFTQAVIREAHLRLVQGVRGGAAAPGAYRRVQNTVVDQVTGEVVYTPPPAYAVPARMAELVDWLESTRRGQHPVVTAAIAHYELAAVHPFLDGNGRAARLIATACLERGGYGFTRLVSVSAHYDRDRAAYYGALRSADGAADLSAWIEYVATGIARTAIELTSRGVDALWLDGLAIEHGLNDRQRAAVRNVREMGGLAIRDYQALFPETPRRTLQHELGQLVRTGLVVAEGAGPSTRYLAGPPLRER
jgi:Fic family protein